MSAYLTAKAWPFEEARKVLDRIGNTTPAKGYVLFETGYGPSGLPHIGTFGEVVRTTMVRNAFRKMSDIPTKLFCFSDDRDGLRKVPENVPNRDMLERYLGMPLTSVPDPFTTEYQSFGHGNNARLRAFLDSFGLEYEFQSSTDWYTSRRFDDVLFSMMSHYDEIQQVMLPTLGKDRQESYSIFLPISPSTGKILQVPVQVNASDRTITFIDVNGNVITNPLSGETVKLQWKADWAARWVALDVDYEMFGKDLITSAELSSKIANILGAKQPEGFTYELFLDKDGRKISKSLGNGLSIEEWLRYAPAESLSYYMYQQPKRAKKLYSEVIPRAVDEYMAELDRYPNLILEKAVENPVFYIHNGYPPVNPVPGINFAALLNLAGVANTEDVNVLWNYLKQYKPDIEQSTALMKLLSGAIEYYKDYIKPKKKYRIPSEAERLPLIELSEKLNAMLGNETAEEIQSEIYEIGKRHYDKTNLVSWFKAIYETVLGSETGPRMGVFIKLIGIDASVRLIDIALTTDRTKT